MLETPSYCATCGHRYLVHNWRNPALVAGGCLVPGCDCLVFIWSAIRPAHATDAGLEDTVYGRLELRPAGNRGGAGPLKASLSRGHCLPEFFPSIGLIMEAQTCRR